jgi:hypothetical protein
MVTTSASEYPRPLTPGERAWCAWLLPRDRPAYAHVAAAIDPLVVLGLGRWGVGDLVLGTPGQTIDLRAPMEPVAAYGEVTLEDGAVLSISIHHPDDDDRVEMHCTGAAAEQIETGVERSRWCYSYWSPGEPSPSDGGALRELTLDERAELVLALDPRRRVMWLHDAVTRGNTLIPVTNFYNELMLLKGVRDPDIALVHRRLFDNPEESSDAELRAAFRRYNATWRKVDADRLGVEQTVATNAPGLFARIARALRGGGAR